MLARGPGRRDLQRRRLEREAEPRDRARRLRAARRAAGASRRPLRAPHHPRHRPARPRPPLRHRREQDRARARLAAGRDLRDRLRKTVRWYLDNAAWVERVQNGAYRDWVAANYEQRQA